MGILLFVLGGFLWVFVLVVFWLLFFYNPIDNLNWNFNQERVNKRLQYKILFYRVELRGAHNCVDLFILQKNFHGERITKWLDNFKRNFGVSC